MDILADVKHFICFSEVNESANYLENHRAFTKQSRVTFKYKCKTHFKELQMKEIISEQQLNQRELNSKNASHMVVCILYWVYVIIIFDRNSSEEEDELQRHRKLEAMVKFFSKASVESNTDKEKKKIYDNLNFYLSWRYPT